MPRVGTLDTQPHRISGSVDGDGWPLVPPTLVTVHRTSRQDEGTRQIVIAIDGVRQCQLLYGQRVTRELLPGRHTMRVHNTLFWKTFDFDVEPGGHDGAQLLARRDRARQQRFRPLPDRSQDRALHGTERLVDSAEMRIERIPALSRAAHDRVDAHEIVGRTGPCRGPDQLRAVLRPTLRGTQTPVIEAPWRHNNTIEFSTCSCK